MTRRTKYLAAILAALVALILAATAGAVIRSTIFTIAPMHYARLSGTPVYCQNVVNKQNVFEHAFNCNVFGSTSAVPKSYGLVVTQLGVGVARWPATGSKAKLVRAFQNR